MSPLRHLVAMIQHTPFLQRDPPRIFKTRIPEKIQAGSGEREEQYLVGHTFKHHSQELPYVLDWSPYLSIHCWYLPSVSTDSGAIWTTKATGASASPWYLDRRKNGISFRKR